MSDGGQQPQPVTERIPGPSLVGSPVILPDVRRRAKTGRAPAPIVQPYTRARTHEAKRPTRSAARRHAESAPRWLRIALLVLTVDLVELAMLHDTEPPSLAQIWGHHRASADYYRGSEALSWARWPRLAWGCLHVPFVALLYAFVWVMHTVPGALALAAVAALAVWWPF